MTDQQFLAGIWQKVEQLERDEREVQQAKERHRQLRRRSFAAGLAAVLLIAGAMAISLLVNVALTGLAILPVLGGFLLDSVHQTDKENIHHESS